jgi:hypothetical protein
MRLTPARPSSSSGAPQKPSFNEAMKPIYRLVFKDGR